MTSPPKMVSGRPLRVLHCPWNIGGHPAMLARFEREAGLHSHSVTLTGDRYGFAADEVLFDPGIGPWEQERRRLSLLLRAIRRFDVIHFNFGQTILEASTMPRLGWPRPWAPRQYCLSLYRYLTWLADLPVLHALNKVVVVTYQGDDARQDVRCDRARGDSGGCDTSQDDAWRRRAINRVARYADRIYALNPDLLRVLPRGTRFLPYANVDPIEWTPSARLPGDPPVIVHAPTDRRTKGTSILLTALDELRRDGVRFELALVENLPHAEVRAAYERADLVVDQLLAGWYGGFAVEAMCLAKPVVAYIRNADLAPLPAEFVADLPIVRATAQSIKGVLRELLTSRRRELPELGRRSRRFVEKWHDPRRIAATTAGDYGSLLAARHRRHDEPDGAAAATRAVGLGGRG